MMDDSLSNPPLDEPNDAAGLPTETASSAVPLLPAEHAKTLPTTSGECSRTGAIGATATAVAVAGAPLDRMMSITRSRSSGEMLARAEFLIVIPALEQ